MLPSTRNLVFMETNKQPTKMIKEFSKRVTTVALATAGSVAAFGFATTSPAQAATILCPGEGAGFTLTQFALLGENGCYRTDKKFVFKQSNPTDGAIANGAVLISDVSTATLDLHSFNYRPSPPLSHGPTPFTIDYTIEIFNDPATSVDETLNKFFHEFSVGYDATGIADVGITVSKTVWLDAIGGTQLVGTSTAKSPDLGGPSAGNIVTLGSNVHVQKLFVRDVFGTDTTSGVLNSVTNDFTQKTKATPEPSAILAVLAVAGIGAFARRKS